MNTDNSKTNEPHKFVFNVLKKLDFKSSNKHVVLQTLFIYYTGKNKTTAQKQQTQNNSFNVEGYIFWSFTRDLSNKYTKQLLDNATKTGLDATKAVTKKVAQKETEAAGEFIGNKIVDKIMKLKPAIDESSRNSEKLVILPQKRQEI